MYIGFHVKYSLFLSDFSDTRIFSTSFRKIQNFMKILPVGAELSHADGQTDMTGVTVAFAILRTRLKIEPVLIKE